MPWLIIAIIVGALIMANRGPTEGYDAIFKKYGDANNIDWRLLKAVAMKESSLVSSAVNAADPSFGLMQILCRYDSNGVCTNNFDVDGWDGATKQKLLDPDFNVMIGAQILAWNLRKFGYPKGIAVYNSWDQRTQPVNGPFKNQNYVDDVLANLEDVKAGVA